MTVAMRYEMLHHKNCFRACDGHGYLGVAAASAGRLSIAGGLRDLPDRVAVIPAHICCVDTCMLP